MRPAAVARCGYNTTSSALCEHVDNAIEAGATVVRIYFRQAGRRGALQTDVLVYDNGNGMAP
jgi:DNA mismatch repair ATPase MutL